MVRSNITEVSRDFAGFSATVRTGDRSKQRLVNGLTITVGEGAVQTTARLTVRQARALRRLLEDVDM